TAGLGAQRPRDVRGAGAGDQAASGVCHGPSIVAPVRPPGERWSTRWVRLAYDVGHFHPPSRRTPMTPHCRAPLTVAVALLALVTVAPVASAQIAVAGNENKVVLVNGVVTVVPNAPPDNVAIIDLK